jgi:hypothetical protein
MDHPSPADADTDAAADAYGPLLPPCSSPP